MTLTNDLVLRRYTVATYLLGYFVGLIIVASTIGLHYIELALLPVITAIVFHFASLLLSPMMASGG